jgi:hypothetical protein
MKKLTMIAAAMLASLALGSMAFAAGADKVTTTLSASYKGAPASDPYGTSYFQGKVGPKACAKKRKVSVSGYGSTKTDEKGKFKLSVGTAADPGSYRVKVAAKETKKTVCTKAKTTVKVK